MAEETKHEIWSAHIERWSASKESQKTYCRKNAISLSTFGWWRRKLGKDPCPTGMSRELIEISFSDEAGLEQKSTSLVVRLPSGIEILVTEKTDTDLLLRVVRTLERTR